MIPLKIESETLIKAFFKISLTIDINDYVLSKIIHIGDAEKFILDSYSTENILHYATYDFNRNGGFSEAQRTEIFNTLKFKPMKQENKPNNPYKAMESEIRFLKKLQSEKKKTYKNDIMAR